MNSVDSHSKTNDAVDKNCCSIDQKTMFNTVIIIDCIFLLRLPPAALSFNNRSWLKFYYYYRMSTFLLLIAIWIIGFLCACWLVLDGRYSTFAFTPIIAGIVGGIILAIDYNFCIVVRRQLMKAIKKDRKKQRKIKGRMLSQKAHKGSVRIDTPPPFHASNDHKSMGSRGPRQKIHPSSHSQKYNLSRTKTLHRAKSDSNSMSGMDHSSFKASRKRRSSFQSLGVPRLPPNQLEYSMRGAGRFGQSRGRGKSYSRERQQPKKHASYRKAQSGPKGLNILDYTASGLSSSDEGSSVDPTAKQRHVKVVYTVTSSVHLSRAGSRSIGDFTKLTDRKSNFFQSGISCSHKFAPDIKNLDFREPKRRRKHEKSQANTSVRKTTHTSYKK